MLNGSTRGFIEGIDRWIRLSRAPNDRSLIPSGRDAVVPSFVQTPMHYAWSAMTSEGPHDFVLEFHAASRELSEAVFARPASQGEQELKPLPS